MTLADDEPARARAGHGMNVPAAVAMLVAVPLLVAMFGTPN
jgi:hypothetical protein